MSSFGESSGALCKSDCINSYSDDVCQAERDQNLAQVHRGGRTASTEQQSSLRGNPVSGSGETTAPIPSNQRSLRNGR
ncbi:unnamed protein product [Protopolystoma xenopodis]|uniref:Uncharacterized protein n=1 Tax=Protopolystoma xenopodis TaxID=117903 RepID=A0A3S5BBI2_9PLAT|nr:unnamed protein product [Protopolystoma xenopodis]